MSGCLGALTIPTDLIWKVEGLEKKPTDPNYANDWIKNKIAHTWTPFYALIGFGVGFSILINKVCFSTLGENVTHDIRSDLYKGILKKNIGWFDLPLNTKLSQPPFLFNQCSS